MGQVSQRGRGRTADRSPLRQRREVALGAVAEPDPRQQAAGTGSSDRAAGGYAAS